MSRETSGILALYETPTELNTQPSEENYRVIQPVKTVKNLVTSISSIAVNNDNSLVVFASHMKFESIKVVHLNSMNVFLNWPSKKDRLGCVRCLGISGDNSRSEWEGVICRVFGDGEP